MLVVVTPDMEANFRESNRRMLENAKRIAAESAARRIQWEKAHPPCPTCGHYEPYLDWGHEAI